MRDLKIMAGIVYFCAAGVLVSFGGGIYTAVQAHQEESKPHPSVFPTPASLSPAAGTAAAPQRADGGLPTPAQ